MWKQGPRFSAQARELIAKGCTYDVRAKIWFTRDGQPVPEGFARRIVVWESSRASDDQAMPYPPRITELEDSDAEHDDSSDEEQGEEEDAAEAPRFLGDRNGSRDAKYYTEGAIQRAQQHRERTDPRDREDEMQSGNPKPK
ncbi:hypothetical protein B0A48_17456 [Cryoendolithus antarcticus]|uniref:Uncharacterized protein n=1 Tax=Cryoendolithus antarcticus TaxID=1507870 RepID=A0A1V8SCM4_9PEZI|nr:hypothetical protein B0A48_17456 [Cryoendolithus antarcticus]